MSRHSLKLVLVAISLGSLTLALPTHAPWRDDATLAPAHVDSDLLQGLMVIQASHEQEPTLAQPGDSKAVARARHWLGKRGIERRHDILQSPPEDLPAWLVRRNPYQLSGCLFVGGATGAAPLPGQAHCLPPAALPQARVAQCSGLVPGATDLGTSLAAYRLPSGLPAEASQGQPAPEPGKVTRWPVSSDRPELITTLVKGRDAMLTLLPEQQQAAQDLLERMTARRPEPLPALQQRNAAFMEQARARMLGLLVVDIATGQIEVAASSTSPCYAQWHASNDRQALSADCASLPPQQRPKPLNLRNAALYFDAMPGSLTKLLEGLTLLDQGAAPETLRPLLLRSHTEAVIDLMFCADRGFDLACANRHLSGLADWAGRLAPAQIDLLGPLGDMAHLVHGSRLLAVMNKGRSPTAPETPDTPGTWPGLTQGAALVDCHQRGAARRWRACHGAHLVDTVAELMGQGNARVTPVGVASQWLGLARLASGQPNSSLPFLAWDPAQGLPGTPADAARRPAAGSAAAATLLGLLDAGHTAGTSHSACLAAQAHASTPGQRLDCQHTHPGLRVASKTGTPLWRVDARFTHDAWVRHCQAPPASGSDDQRLTVAARAARDAWLTDCRLSPIKWWAAAIGDGRGWHKVVVAVAERNWQADGWIDDRRDIGSNVAAEAGLAYVQGRWAGLPINAVQH